MTGVCLDIPDVIAGLKSQHQVVIAGAVGAPPPLPSHNTRDQATSGVAGTSLYLVLQGAAGAHIS